MRLSVCVCLYFLDARCLPPPSPPPSTSPHPQEYYYNVVTKRAKWSMPAEGMMWERKLEFLQQLTPRAVDPTAVARGLVKGGGAAEPQQWKWRETVGASVATRNKTTQSQRKQQPGHNRVQCFYAPTAQPMCCWRVSAHAPPLAPPSCVFSASFRFAAAGRKRKSASGCGF